MGRSIYQLMQVALLSTSLLTKQRKTNQSLTQLPAAATRRHQGMSCQRGMTEVLRFYLMLPNANSTVLILTSLAD